MLFCWKALFYFIGATITVSLFVLFSLLNLSILEAQQDETGLLSESGKKYKIMSYCHTPEWLIGIEYATGETNFSQHSRPAHEDFRLHHFEFLCMAVQHWLQKRNLFDNIITYWHKSHTPLSYSHRSESICSDATFPIPKLLLRALQTLQQMAGCCSSIYLLCAPSG